MIEVLTGLGYGIIAFAVMVGIGIVILATLGNNVASQSATANTTINTIVGYLGTSNGGLASWLPIIIVMVVGLFFLGAFLTKKGSKA
jgi:hypothetical protein